MVPAKALCMFPVSVPRYFGASLAPTLPTSRTDTLPHVPTLYHTYRHCTTRTDTVPHVPTLYHTYRHCTTRDFRFQPQTKWNLRFSGTLRVLDCWLSADVSRKPIGSTFKSQEIDDGTDRLSLNVAIYSASTSQKSKKNHITRPQSVLMNVSRTQHYGLLQRYCWRSESLKSYYGLSMDGWMVSVGPNKEYVVGSKTFRPDIQKPRQM